MLINFFLPSLDFQPPIRVEGDPLIAEALISRTVSGTEEVLSRSC